MLPFRNDISLGLILHDFGISCDLEEACGVYPPVCLPGLFNDKYSFDFCCDAGAGRDGFMLRELINKIVTQNNSHPSGRYRKFILPWFINNTRMLLFTLIYEKEVPEMPHAGACL